MVQNPCKEELIYQDGKLVPDPEKGPEDYIREYQARGWLPYQWGVWCTCYARLKLEAGIRAIPPGAFLYADTDSVKFIGDYAERFEVLNKNYLHPDLCAADPSGELHFIGIFERDDDGAKGNPIRRFKTMGAKKYAYEDNDGLHVTISGVHKKKGAHELGRLENFKEGFVFRDAGGSCSYYNDDPDPAVYRVDGREIRISSNVYIEDSTYTLSMTPEYQRLLDLLTQTDIRKSLYFDQDSKL